MFKKRVILNLKQLFMILFLLNAITLSFVAFVISEYQASTKMLENAYEMRYKSLVLADELRQSSDDLTRMARTYVLTGNIKFEQQYKTVLDIRNGKQPRPARYNGIFWDFYTLKNSKPEFLGEKIPLRELMKLAKFPEEELELLFISQNESDDLTKLEAKAMNAMKGIFQDENGIYNMRKAPNFKLARELMYSDEYHKAKIRIMKPLDDFYKAFEYRTLQKVINSNKRVKELEGYVNLVVLVSISLFLMSFGIILSRIIFPLESLRKTMSNLAKNDMNTKIQKSVYVDEVGEMIDAVSVFKDNTQKLISGEQMLKVAINDALRANKSKSIFLAKMSHELRTPLNAILGFASLVLKSKNLNSNEYENISIIKKSGKHLLGIINEILELSKIEAGKIELSPKVFNFFEMLKDIESIIIFRCRSKNLNFVTTIEPGVPNFILADEQRLKQILINLLNNAIKFTNQGSISLNTYSKNRKLFFEIKDTGIGILEENINVIFTPFEQVGEQKNSENGTGLGLSISKELISLMGGSINVKSVVGVGSEFRFSIIYKIPSEKDGIQTKNNKLIGLKTLSISKNILVVDDIEENRKLVVQILNQYGFVIYEAKNGIEALKICDEQKLDLIFMDMLMPQMDGFQVASNIRSSGKTFAEIPIIALSANVLSDDKIKVYNHKINDFLPKPFEENEILLMLNKYLDISLEFEHEKFLSKNGINFSIKISTLDLIVKNAEIMNYDEIYKIIQNDCLQNNEFAICINKMLNEFRFPDIIEYCLMIKSNQFN